MGDWNPQTGTVTLTAGETSKTVSITAVGSLDHAFALLLNTARASNGNAVTTDIEDYGVTVELTAVDTLTFRRKAGAQPLTAQWLVLEDTSAGGTSGFTVLEHGEHTMTGTTLAVTHTTTGGTLGQIVPIICGVRSAATGTCGTDQHIPRLKRNTVGASVLDRFDGATNLTVSVAIIELGTDFNVDEILGTTNGTTQTQAWACDDVADWANAFIVGSHQTDGATGIDDTMLMWWPNPADTTEVKTYHDNAGDTLDFALYVISHPDLVVQHNDTIDGTLISDDLDPSHTVTAVTAGWPIGSAASPLNYCGFNRGWLNYSVTGTTWQWDQTAGAGTGNEPELAIQLVELAGLVSTPGAAAAAADISITGTGSAAMLGAGSLPALNIVYAGGAASYALLTNKDRALADRLISAGHTLTYLDLDGTPAVESPTVHTTVAELATACASADLLIITSSWKPWALHDNALDTLAVPALVMEGYYIDDASLAGTSGETSGTHTDIDIVAPGHPLAAGLTGTITVLDQAERLNYATITSLPTGAIAVATPAGDPTRAVIAAIDTGVTLTDGTTNPARRAILWPNYYALNELTADGDLLVDAAIEWLAGTTGATAAGASATTDIAIGVDSRVAEATNPTDLWPRRVFQIAPGIPVGQQPTDGQWVDITAYVFDRPAIGVNRGRNSDLELTDPSTPVWHLDNSDRRFEPDHPDSPYYPNMVPLTHARELTVWRGITRPVWAGYILDITPTWPGANTDARVIAQLADLFAVAAGTTINGGYLPAWLRSLGASGLAAHFPLHETDGTWHQALTGDSSLDINLTKTGTGEITAGSDSYSTASNPTRRYPHLDGAAYLNGTHGGAGDALAATGPVWRALWLRRDLSVEFTTAAQLGDLIASDLGRAGLLEVSTSGGLSWTHGLPGATAGVTVATGATLSAAGVNLLDGNWHHIVVARTNSASPYTFDVYVDGEHITTTGWTTTATPSTTADRVYIGRQWPGWIAEHTYGVGEITADAVAELYDALRDILPAATTGDRIADLAEYLGLGADLTNIDAGGTSMPARDFAGTNLLQALQQAATAELGILYPAADGRLTFHDRQHRATQTTPAATLGTLVDFLGAHNLTDQLDDDLVGYAPLGDANPPATGLSSSPAAPVITGARGQPASLYQWGSGNAAFPAGVIPAGPSFTVAFTQRMTVTPGTGAATRYIYLNNWFYVLPYATGAQTSFVLQGYDRLGQFKQFNLLGTLNLDADAWQHIVAVYDDDDEILRLYVDGALAYEWHQALQPIAVARFFFGFQWTNGTIKIDLGLHDMTLIDRALTASEVAQLAATTLAGIELELDPANIVAASPLDRIANIISVTTPDGDGVTVLDSTSVGRYLERPLSLNVDIDNPATLTQIAAHLLATRKDPHLHIAAVTVNGATDPDRFATLLTLEIGDLVQLKIAPHDTSADPSGTPLTVDAYIEAVDITHTADVWQFTYALSPAAASQYTF